jgi:drug/metabolite transporter (DMT)-like permease
LPHFVLLALIVVAGTGGELCVSRAMKGVAEPLSLHPAAISRIMRAALLTPWMWLGLAMMTAAFMSLLAALSIYDVSFVVPVTALSYVVGVCGSATFLRESVKVERWLGVAVVTIGVMLVILGKS